MARSWWPLALSMTLLAGSAGAAPEVAGKPYRVYVTNEFSGTLSVIDGATNKVETTLPLGKRPRGVQLSHDGTRLFVALSGSPVAGPGVDESTLPPADKGADGIGVVDLATLEVEKTLRGVSDPEQMVVDHEGQHVFIASEDTGKAVIIDVPSGRLVKNLDVGGEPEGVALSPDGRYVYMTSESDHKVSVIDVATTKVIAQFDVGSRPRGIAFARDQSRAYVTNEMSHSITVVNARTHTVIGNVTLPDETLRPMGVVVSPDGKVLYVTTGRGSLLMSIDTHTFLPIRSVAVGPRPWGLAMSPDGRYLYTANGPSNDVAVVDTRTFSVVERIKVGERPWGVAIGW